MRICGQVLHLYEIIIRTRLDTDRKACCFGFSAGRYAAKWIHFCAGGCFSPCLASGPALALEGFALCCRPKKIVAQRFFNYKINSMKKLFPLIVLSLMTLLLSRCTDELQQVEPYSAASPDGPQPRNRVDTLSNFFQVDYVSNTNQYLLPAISLRSSIDLLEEARKQLAELDMEKGFVKNIVRKYGYPVWDRSSILYGTNREEFVITPLAFTDGKAITGYFIAIYLDEIFWFRLVKKDKMDKAIEGKGDLKDWKNLPFGVLKSVALDRELFGFTNQPYIDWFLAQNGSEIGFASITARSCSLVETEICEPIYAIVSTNEECTTYVEEICTPGGDSGRCQECSGGDDGGATGGGSSGSGSGSTSGLLPYYDGISDVEMVYHLDGVFGLRPEQENFLLANPELIQTVYDAYNSATEENIRADNLYEALKGQTHFPVDPYDLSFETIYLLHAHPNWSKSRIALTAYLNVALGQTHTMLDIIGFLPGAGEPADFLNGVLYLLEGDGLNASISILATFPGASWVLVTPRLAFKVVKKVDGISNYALYMYKDQSGLIRFVTKNGLENRGQLRSVMQTPKGKQAHHIMPWAKRTDPIIQKAAESGKFHMNDKLNGINLDLNIHNGSHNAYDNRLQEILDDISSVRL